MAFPRGRNSSKTKVNSETACRLHPVILEDAKAKFLEGMNEEIAYTQQFFLLFCFEK